MGRRRTIDRGRVLDAAEELIARDGPSGLTIDAVAKAAGITKGGVQYTFGSRDDLITAMLERWWQSYDAAWSQLAGDAADARTAIWAHIEATRMSGNHFNPKAAALLAVLTQNPERLESTREWYLNRLASLNGSDGDDRRARLAFLAAEGIFLLRFFGFLEVEEGQWQEIFDDIENLLARPD